MPKRKDLKTPLEVNERLIKDYRETFNTAAGKRVIEDLELRGYYRTTTIAGQEHIMIYREGARSMVAHIKTMVEYDIKELREYFKEMEKLQDLEPEL